jgi:hypothetical protein
LIFENRKDAVIRPRLSQKIKIDRQKIILPRDEFIGFKIKKSND